jgi:hypothetical protein
LKILINYSFFIYFNFFKLIQIQIRHRYWKYPFLGTILN